MGETLICLKGPAGSSRSSASVASTTYTVFPIASITSTDLDKEYAGGMMDHDTTGSVGGIASSFGRGSSYRLTEIR